MRTHQPVGTATVQPTTRGKERGLALMMTLLFLSSLLLLGISLTTMVRLEFEEAVMYRMHNEAHLNAQEGMNTAIGFLMYDVWGVNEREPFVCSRFKALPTDGGKSDLSRLGDSFITDAGGPEYAFQYDNAPLMASELELQRVVYTNVPAVRFNAAESVSLLADWDWQNTNIGGGSRVWQFENYGTATAGRSRYTDAFLPTDSDVNDWFELGLHYNRGDLQAFFRQNFPNRAADLYAGGVWGGWGHQWDSSPVGSYSFTDFGGESGYNYPFAEGHALDGDPVVAGPWNFVNTNQMIGDSFTRVFRSDLVDNQYRNGTYGAMCLGPQMTAPDGTPFGGAININEVNNNYELESNPGVIAPAEFATTSPDYNAQNTVDSPVIQRFYYSGRSYHYNEAKWIYTYNSMGKPEGRYAVTVLSDGGMPNVNGLGNPRYGDTLKGGWYPLTVEWPGIFPDFDRGTNALGQSLYARQSYGSPDNTAPDGAWNGNWYGSTFRLWSDEAGANRIKNGGINPIRKPGMPNLYDDNIDGNYFALYNLMWSDEQADPKFFRICNNTNWWRSEITYGYSVFAMATGHLNHPKMLDYNPAAASEWYAGPRQDAGNLKIFGQGIISHTFWHLLSHGPIRTRAEFMMLLKKRAFMIDDENGNGMAANRIDENPRGNGSFYDTEDWEIAESDCQYIAGWLTPIGYSYTLDSQWNRDRVVLDSTADLYMGGAPTDKSGCYFWTGICSQSRAGGDMQSMYQGPCPTAANDDPAGVVGAAAALAAGDMDHPYMQMYRQVKGKSGAKALLQSLAQLRYFGDGLGLRKGGLTAYNPTASRLTAAGAAVAGFDNPAAAVRRANKAGAHALAYILSTCRNSNRDYRDCWRYDYFRKGETAGVVVNWKQNGANWDPDITIWPNMHWRQAWEVAAMAEFDRTQGSPGFGAFALHQYASSTPTEVGRARVYMPYYRNDLNGGQVTGNNDIATPYEAGSTQRVFLPKYTETPYNQWMDYTPRYANDPVPMGWRQVWGNQTVSVVQFEKLALVADQQYPIRVQTATPTGVHPGDTVRITGAGEAAYNRDFIVMVVDGPDRFEVYLPKAAGDPVAAVSAGGTVDLRLTADPTGSGGVDTRYPQGIPLIMNYIELCLNYAHRFAHAGYDENEFGESLANRTWHQNYMSTQVFRMWVADTTPSTAANLSGWTNLYDGMPFNADVLTAAENTWDKCVRLHAGAGNGQPFLYVKGRLMQMDPNNPAAWYTAPDGKPGVRVLVNMLDQFDPVHYGVSVREVDSGGNLSWVTYNSTALEQRAVQRIFGKMTDMTWGVGEDRIPAGDASIDNGHRWTTRTGNRGLFIRGHSPVIMQGKFQAAPDNYHKDPSNWQIMSGVHTFPLNSYLIDMPTTLAMRQLVEKHVSPMYPKGFSKGLNVLNPKHDVAGGGSANLGSYLNSFCWFTTQDAFGQDCDWRAFHWWAMDGNLGAAAYPGGPTIQYDGTAPILPWKWEWDHSIDGSHGAFVKSGGVSNYSALVTPTGGNASMQAMTQGHPHQYKVIYFHPYFFPQKMVYGTRSRTLGNNPEDSLYYDYFYPRQTVDNGEKGYNPNLITSISRDASGTVTATYTGDWETFYGQTTGAGYNYGTPLPTVPDASRNWFVRIEDCVDPSFNGVYEITQHPGTGTFSYKQSGLPQRAAITATPGSADSSPVGTATLHTAFGRNFSGGQYMYCDAPVGGSWGQLTGAPVLAEPTNMASPLPASGFGSNVWNPDCSSYFPVDYCGGTPARGGNANAQAPVEVVERVHGIVTLPDYLGENDIALRATAQQLWTRGPWWVDGDEAQGPVMIDTVAGLAVNDWVQTGNGAHGRVVTLTGGKSGNRVVIQPCLPTTAAFVNGDSIGRIDRDPSSAGFLNVTALGTVANSEGQRLWQDYGRYNSGTIATLTPMDATHVDPAQPPYAVPPASYHNTYLRGVLEFSLSTPWVQDNQDSSMWQYNSTWGFKANGAGALATDPSIYGAAAATRTDPAFGGVRWYLAKGTDHACQVFSLPTPGERNSNHIAWGASPYQRDRWATGVEDDPNRPGFRRNTGHAGGSPVSQFIESKLELAAFMIGITSFTHFKKDYFVTPIGRLSADEEDIHELNWWDLAESTPLESMYEIGIMNGSSETHWESRSGVSSFFDLGKDPLSPGVAPDGWQIANWARKFDMAQNYTNNTSYNDFIDNQDRGIREILTKDPLRGVKLSEGRVEGHYNADYKTVFKINPNLIPAPMLYQWLLGDYRDRFHEPTYVLGNKPARGYISTAHMAWYVGAEDSGYNLTHFSSRVWYKNQCTGPTPYDTFNGVGYMHQGYARMSNMVIFSPSPVYTLMITGEQMNASGHPVAQIRLTVGVERTFDGKCNILEYQINPGLVEWR